MLGRPGGLIRKGEKADAAATQAFSTVCKRAAVGRVAKDKVIRQGNESRRETGKDKAQAIRSLPETKKDRNKSTCARLRLA
jgi:hypothetical protein